MSITDQDIGTRIGTDVLANFPAKKAIVTPFIASTTAGGSEA